jgi:hypothetical protein
MHDMISGINAIPRHPSDPPTRLQAALRRERRRRLAAIARYDRYIAEAAGDLGLQAFWRNLQRQDKDDAQRLKNRLSREAAHGVL